MSTRTILRLAITFMVLGGFATAGHAEGPKVGLAIHVESDGFFLNPIITKITVDEVVKASIAERAGIVAGDEVVQIEGRTVVGKRAKELQPFMHFNAGETRTLRLKHAGGEEFEARITKPKE